MDDSPDFSENNRIASRSVNLRSDSELRAEIERLRAALTEIAREQSARTATDAADRFQRIAREALK